MKAPRCRFVALSWCAALAITTSAASAQIPGNIDMPVAPGGVGFSVAVDAAQGLNNDAGEALYMGARMIVSLPRSAVWAGGGYAGMRSGEDNLATAGAGVALALTDLGLASVSVDAGVGGARRFGQWLVGATAGPTLRFDLPGSTLVPFVRAHGLVVRSGGQTEFGVSAVGGADIRLPALPDFHLAFQWEHVDASNAVVVGGGFTVGL